METESIGWVVNGPLGRHHRGQRATSFFVKADPELQRIVKDFYDSGFNESSAEDRPEMSQEELRFLRELQSTVVLKDGHQREDSTQVRNGMANLASSKVGMAIVESRSGRGRGEHQWSPNALRNNLAVNQLP